MSAFLRNLAARSLGLAAVVRPRLAPMFAPPAAEPRGVGNDDFAVAAAADDLSAELEVDADAEVSLRMAPPRDEQRTDVPDARVHARVARHDDASREPEAAARSRGLAQTNPTNPTSPPLDGQRAVDPEPAEPSAAVRRILSSTTVAQVPESGEGRLPLATIPLSQQIMAEPPSAAADVAPDARQHSSAAVLRTTDLTDALVERTHIALADPGLGESPSPEAAPVNAMARTIASASLPGARTAAPPSGPDSTPFDAPFDARFDVPVSREAARSLAVSTAPSTLAGNAASTPPMRGPDTLPAPARPSRGRRNPGSSEPPADHTEPTIHVSIGRVEIRAVPAPAAPSREASRDERTPTRLETYLRRHAGGSDT